MKHMVQFSELMGNKSLVTLIKFFLENPTAEPSYTEIRKQTNLAKATLTKWLKFMAESNLISSKSIGRSILYKLNRLNVLIKQLKILNNILHLLPLARISKEKDFEIFIFGSVSRGEDVEKSDVDLLVLGNVKLQDINKQIEKVKSSLGRELKVQIFSIVEWADMARKDKAFYERVEKDKIKLE